MREGVREVSRTILMLGGSRQQVVAVEKARELGFRTVLCDYLPDNPGQFSADAYYPVSTTDREAVLGVARAEGVEGVLAYSSDPASPTAGYVAEALGLPTNPLPAIETMSEKHLFRAFLARQGLPCPGARAFSAGADPGAAWGAVSGLRMPVVVKPTDSSGSKGVSVVDRAEAFPAAMRRAAGFSRNGTLICEEFIERAFPHVVGGDIFVVGGEVRFWGLMACLRGEGGSGLVPVGEFAPPGLPGEWYAGVKRVLQRLVSALGVRFGELNVEVIVGEGGEPYVLELGSRAGGNMIPVQLSDASGIDLVAANVLCAMGEDPGDLSWESRHSGPICTYVVHSEAPGVYGGLELSGEVAPHVYREVMYVGPGDAVGAFDGANKALGVLFLRFDDEAQMGAIMSRAAYHVRPVVEAAR